LATRHGKTYTKGFPKSLFRKVKVIKSDQLYPWQEKIVKECEEEPDDRSINWVWEKKGNVGKSALVKYLCIHSNALLISGKSADIKYQIAAAEFPPDIVVYDIPRTAQGYINYTALEEVKNGVFCSSKYESKMVIIPTPHVYCFANFEPNMETMSKDRWKLINLNLDIDTDSDEEEEGSP
jgi:hypothetical protein